MRVQGFINNVYKNVYKGNPSNAFDAAITLGYKMYESEEAAKAAIDNTPVWKPYHIGFVKLNS